MTIKINGREYQAYAEQTILQAARANGVFIPSLCFSEGLKPTGACGICIVEAEGRLLRACATAVRDGMVIETNSARVAESRRSLLELTLSAHTGDCKAPCQLACPAQSDCQGYIALIAAGKMSEAVELMKDAHPFPASVARICPRPCESECRRKLADGDSVNIAGLKRFAADWEIAQPEFFVPKIAEATGMSVAVVGGGPAGLTAAFFLRKAGHDVSVFDANPKMGGLLRYGIPEYRLPKAVLDAELEVLTRMGINFFNGMSLGRDITMTFLQARYDSVIVATGAGVSKPIWCKGEDAAGVFGGIDFLKAVADNNPPVIGKRVVVIGGSNTAMDAARTALRLGASVMVSYRRTRDEMPAEDVEVNEALAEGVVFNYLTAPLEVVSRDGRVAGIRLQKMELGEPDESGRRKPIPVEGGEEFIEADTIIAAIGQDVSLEGLNPLENFKTDNDFKTDLPNVYAIGDATGKSSYAIDAIGHGRKVAQIVGGALAGEVIPEIIVRDIKKPEDFADVAKAPRQNEHMVHPEESLTFDPVQEGLTAAEASEEAKRCLSCGCADFYECKLVSLANMYGASVDRFPAEFHKRPKHVVDKSNFSFHRDMNKCVLCGLCVGICAERQDAQEVLSAVNRGFDTTVTAAFGLPIQNRDECTLCGNCVARCPVGALTEVSPLPKQLVAREQITSSTCMGCGNGCNVLLATTAGQVLRCLPPEGKMLCENGRFGFLRLGEKLLTPLVKKGDILRRATLQEAAKAVREGLNLIKAQYGAEGIGIAVSPTLVNEDIAAIKAYADMLGTPHIFTLTDVEKEEKCNTQGLKNHGVSTESYIEKITSGKIRGLIVFGDELPPELEHSSLEFLAVQTAYAAGLKSKVAMFASVIIPAPAFGEVVGTITKGDDILYVNAALPPACGFQTRMMVRELKGVT
ncbi:MAG: FAD-dependent oxidoreductase [Defluviitaleaceae bacterium]|nr:FAD-dependent oxidoreductase [Defluviitaleaceae bacterium]